MLKWYQLLYSPDDNPGGGSDPAPKKEPESTEPSSSESEPKGSTTSSSAGSPDAAKARAEAERYRLEAEKNRKEAEELRKWKEEKEREQMDEVEKARADAEKARAEAEKHRKEALELRLENRIRTRLSEEGLAAPDNIVVSGIRSNLDLSEDGDPTNLDDTVEALKKTYPALFGEGEQNKKKPTSSGESKGTGGDRGEPEGDVSDAERAKAARERLRNKHGRI